MESFSNDVALNSNFLNYKFDTVFVFSHVFLKFFTKLWFLLYNKIKYFFDDLHKHILANFNLVNLGKTIIDFLYGSKQTYQHGTKNEVFH